MTNVEVLMCGGRMVSWQAGGVAVAGITHEKLWDEWVMGRQVGDWGTR